MNLRAKLTAYLTLLFLVSASPMKARSQESFPMSPAGKRADEILQALNGESDLDEFLGSAFAEGENTAEERRASAEQVQAQLGKLSLQEIVSSEDYSITFICSTENGPHVELTVGTENEEPHLIEFISLEFGVESTTDPEPLSEDDRQTVVERLASELRSKYVFPDVGEEMAVAVETSLASGEYDDVETDEAMASLLTTQLREICSDLHLRVRPGSPSRRGGGRQAPTNQHQGFVKAEYLDGNIGYLKFNGFSSGEEAERTAAAAMNFLAGSKALIFDLRENGGGSPDMIEFLCGYLFDEKVHLNSFYNRPTDTTTTTWSREDVPGHRFGDSIPVYVLTSQNTFSAAEEFTYDLKHLERGIIVGETTGGGAHPVMPVTLGPRLFMTMPFARAINPITNTNWEGVGVKPHVETSASNALETAAELARERVESEVDALVSQNEDSNEAEDNSQLMRVGQELMQDAEFEKAAELFRRVTNADETSEMAWFQLGYCLHMAGKIDEAIEVHQRASEFESVAGVATYNLACAHSLNGNVDEAIEALSRAIELGFGDARQLEQDSDFDNIRDDERFVEILEELGGH